MLRSLDQQHVNCFLALLAARTCLFHATPKTGVSVLAFFPCFAPCVAAHTQKKNAWALQPGNANWFSFDFINLVKLWHAGRPATRDRCFPSRIQTRIQLQMQILAFSALPATWAFRCIDSRKAGFFIIIVEPSRLNECDNCCRNISYKNYKLCLIPIWTNKYCIRIFILYIIFRMRPDPRSGTDNR